MTSKPYDPFVQPETYRRDLHRPIEKPGDPPDEKIGWVELRPLNAGDRAEFNEVKIQTAGGSVQAGMIQLLMVHRAVVAWSFSREPTIDTIRALEPDVFDQIFEHVSLGNPSIAETVAEIADTKKEDGSPLAEPSGESAAESAPAPVESG